MTTYSTRHAATALAICIAFATSCSQVEISSVPQTRVLNTYTFEAAGIDSKLGVDSFGQLTWEDGDEIGMYIGNRHTCARVNPDLQSFTVTTDESIVAGDVLRFYYPYNESNEYLPTEAEFMIPSTIEAGDVVMPMASEAIVVDAALAEAMRRGESTPEVHFVNLGSMLELNVFNTSPSHSGEMLKSVLFCANDNVAGRITLDLSDITRANASQMTLSPSESLVTAASPGTAIGNRSKESGIRHYMAVSPGVHGGAFIVLTDRASYTFKVSPREFARSAGRSFSLDLASGQRGVLPVALPYNEAFTSSIGLFATDGAKVGGSTAVWQQTSLYGMKATAYVSGSRYSSESWLTSPLLSLIDASEPVVSFSTVFRYGSAGDCSMWVRRAGGEWEQVAIPHFTVSSNWNFISTGPIDLSRWKGSIIQIGFKYTSDASNAGTWEIQDFKAFDSIAAPSTPSSGSTTDGSAANGTGWLEMVGGTSTYPNIFLHTFYAGSARNYTYLYDLDLYTSHWVAYPLYSSTINGGRSGSWKSDPNLSTDYQINIWSSSYGVNVGSTTNDGYNSSLNIYARGHQIPDADRSGNSTMQSQTYYPTNCTPQIQNNFNNGVWSALESGVRGMIPSSDTLYVVTGPVFRTVGGSESVTIIHPRNSPEKDCPVPNYYYKVLLKVKRNGSTVSSASTIGFWLEHKTYSSESYESYACSVDFIESKTGLDFFVNLPDTIESNAESNASLSSFYNF